MALEIVTHSWLSFERITGVCKGCKRLFYLSMIGRDIFDFAVRDVAKNIKDITQNVSVDYLLLHQANLRIIEKIARKVKYRKKILNQYG